MPSAVDISYLHECFELVVDSGDLLWRKRPESHFLNSAYARRWNSRWAGRPALGADNGKGYLSGTLSVRGNKVRLQRHRVIFAMHRGSWPKWHVDHLDGDTLNNSPSNLRDATNQENMRNCRRSKANRSGVTGVCWFKPRSVWTAKITVDGKCISLGYHHDINDAIAARKSAEKRYGFSPRHGGM